MYTRANRHEAGRQVSAGVGNSPLHACQLPLIAELADRPIFAFLHLVVGHLVGVHYHLPEARTDGTVALWYNDVHGALQRLAALSALHDIFRYPANSSAFLVCLSQGCGTKYGQSSEDQRDGADCLVHRIPPIQGSKMIEALSAVKPAARLVYG